MIFRFRVIRMLFFAGLSVLFSGCRSGVSEPAFDRIAEKIDAGGSYYHISDAAPLRKYAEQLAAFWEAKLQQQPLPVPMRKLSLQAGCAGAIFYRISGADSLLGWGASSVPISEKSGRTTLFLNRTILAAAPDADGVLWRLFGTENRPLHLDTRPMPVNLLLAAEFHLELQCLTELLKKNGDRSRKQLDALCLAFLKKNSTEVLNSLAGDWKLELFAVPGRKLPGFRLQLPDRQELIHRLAEQLAASAPEKQPDLPPYTLSWKDGTLTIVSGVAPEQPAPGSAIKGEFAEVAALLPPEGIGYLYISRAFATSMLPGGFLPAPGSPEAALLPFQMTVFRTGPEGLTGVGLSSQDFNMQAFSSAMVIPLNLFSSTINRMVQENLQLMRKNQELRRKKEQARREQKRCADFLRRKHPGEMRELHDPGHSGQSTYFVFPDAPAEKHPKQPILADRKPHGDFSNVLLADGSVVAVNTGSNLSAKRIVSCLHARFRYPEPVFRKLLKAASQLDKNNTSGR